MKNQFDEMTKGLAQSVTRRAALKQVGFGLAAMALACFGLANKAQATRSCASDADCPNGQVCSGGRCIKPLPPPTYCTTDRDCPKNYHCHYCAEPYTGVCLPKGVAC